VNTEVVRKNSPPRASGFGEYVAVALLLLEIAILVFNPIGNSDFWAHAKTGEWIWQHKTVPQESLFIYDAEPYRWCNLTWLSALAFYGLTRLGGISAIAAFQFIAIVGTFAVLWRLWLVRGGSLWMGLALFSLAIAVARFRYQPRPELFSAFNLSLLLYWIVTFRIGQRRSLWQVPLLMTVWVNLHGGAMVGYVVLVVYTLGEAAEDAWRRSRGVTTARPDRSLAHLIGVTGVSAATVLVNPYGIRYLTAVIQSPSVYAQYIGEWQPLSHLLQSVDAATLAVLVCFGGVALFLTVVRRRNIPLSFWLLLALATALAWLGYRNLLTTAQICLAAIAASLPPMSNLDVAYRSPNARFCIAKGRCVGSVVVGVCVLAQCVYYLIASDRTIGIGLDQETVPVGAVRFVQDNHIDGRIANVLPDSPYLMWKLFPFRKLLIDAMNDYGEERFASAYLGVESGEEIEALMRRWDFDYALFTLSSCGIPFVARLRDDPQWALVYWDGQAVVYLKRQPKFQELIAGNEYRYASPTAPDRPVRPTDMHRFLAEVERAAGNRIQTASLWTNIGFLLLSAGELSGAEYAFGTALEFRRWSVVSRLGLAQCLVLRGNLKEARQLTRFVRFFRPDISQAKRMEDAINEKIGG